MEKLLKLLAEKGGQIVSTASLSIALIDLARQEDHLFVDGDGLGFVWLQEKSLPQGFLNYVNEPRQETLEIIRRPPGYTVEDLPELFKYHPPKGNQAERYGKISAAAENFARVVLENTPGCADQTVAIRQIIACRMSANMTIALNEKWS